jgi:glutathione peroxidase
MSMKTSLTLTLFLSITCLFMFAMGNKNLHQLSFTDINGKKINFSQYKGKKLLIVNTASECGYTRQYAQLQELYAKYHNKNFEIIAFPCNQFGGQEPGVEAEIKQFCSKNYGVTFPLMKKSDVKGSEQNEVYQFLTKKAANGKMDSDVKWNFQKYLVDAEGNLVKMLPSSVQPGDAEIITWIEGK